MAPFRLARPRVLTYFALEGGLIFAVLYGLAALTRFLLPDAGGDSALPVLTCGAAFTVLLLLTQWGTPSDRANLLSEIVVFTTLSLLMGLTGLASVWVFFDQRQSLTTFIIGGAVAVPITVAGWRWLSAHFSVLNATREKVLILGTGPSAQDICRLIASKYPSEYAVTGFADSSPERLGSVLAMGARIQTDFESLAHYSAGRVDRVIVALDEKRGMLPVRQLMELRLRGIEVEEATSFIERVCGKIAVETMLPSWLIYSEGFRTSPMRSLLKRTADLALSLVLLIAALPLMAVTALAIFLDSGYPVLYRQTRMGMNGRKFDVLKFRSMRQDAEKGGPAWASKHDPRVTRIGRILRPLRIDELPQLFNIFRGEMSFVGPRPERPHFIRQLEKKIPYYGLRMTVRPGLTGWAQVEYGYASTDEDALEKLRYDLYYIKNGNLLFDLWIVAKTIKVVVTSRGH